ncbi:hypothetical protein JCM8097_006699 [Rhodosporidiobolus ruineniae]
MPSAEYTQSDLVDRSPFLAKLISRSRLAPSRLEQFLAAARSSTPPKEPDPWDCCGSSCKPCVRTLWKEEMRVWGEVHPDGVEEEADGEDTGGPAIEIEVEELTLKEKEGKAEKLDNKEKKEGS